MRYEFDRMRGRPNGRRRSQADNQLLEYLAKVSMKYEVDSDKLFTSLLRVYQYGKSQCGKLSIECRLRKQDSAIFLITRGWEVVGQFRVSEQLLNGKVNPIEEFVCRLSATKTLTQGAKSKNCKIRDLKVGMRRLNINARVLKMSQPIQIATRYGLYANLANAIIADETGTINLSLLGSQIKEVTLHDVIQIENAHVAWFKGERQLRVGKHGKINIENSGANNIKMALTDYEKLQNIH